MIKAEAHRNVWLMVACVFSFKVTQFFWNWMHECFISRRELVAWWAADWESVMSSQQSCVADVVFVADGSREASRAAVFHVPEGEPGCVWLWLVDVKAEQGRVETTDPHFALISRLCRTPARVWRMCVFVCVSTVVLLTVRLRTFAQSKVTLSEM